MGNDWEEDADTPLEIAEVRVRPNDVRRACLLVLTGAAAGQMFRLDRPVTIIGRAPDVEIRLIEDGVSRAHARVRVENDAVWVEDLESRNGTHVNGQRLAEPRKLEEGDKVQVGRATVLRFAYHDELDESFHEHLISSALRDPLTRLFNKRYFLDRLDNELKFAIRHETTLSLLMLDIDHFKTVNDTHGHLAGDAVLVNFAGVLTRAVRNEDVVARFGGEEFAIILRAIPLEPATQLAERLRQLVEETVTHVQGVDVRATASFGAAGYPATRAETAEALIEAADKALYRAKGAGRNRVSRLTQP